MVLPAVPLFLPYTRLLCVRTLFLQRDVYYPDCCAGLKDGEEVEDGMLPIKNRSVEPIYNRAFEKYVLSIFRERGAFLLWRNAPAVIVGCDQNIGRVCPTGRCSG